LLYSHRILLKIYRDLHGDDVIAPPGGKLERLGFSGHPTTQRRSRKPDYREGYGEGLALPEKNRFTSVKVALTDY
jgi:hypothetical protein